MITREISSLQHPIVKELVKLRDDKTYRYEQKRVLVVGRKMVEELAEQTTLEVLILLQGNPSSFQAKERFFVTEEILKKITGVMQPEPVAAVIAMPEPADLKGKKFLIALDGISDPGNLGTLIRSALALGWEGVFITGQSSDPYNDKALRAAKGATFRIPLCIGGFQELQALIDSQQLKAYVADKAGKSIEKEKPASPLVLILGSESHGASEEIKRIYPTLSIPMQGTMESLNVAAAGAILMYELRHG